MKINLKRIMYLVILLVFLNASCVLGFKKTDYGKTEFKCASWWGKTKEDVLQILKDVGSYDGSKLNEEMKVSVKFKVNDVSGSGDKAKYKVGIKGLDDQNIERDYIDLFLAKQQKEFSKDEVAKYFGYEDNKELKKGTEWDANIIIYCPDSGADYNNAERGIYLKEVYTGDNLDEIKNSSTSNKEVDNNIVDKESDTVEKVSWVLDFLAHPIKTAIRFIANGICKFNDGIQIRLNEIQTSGDYTDRDEKIMYRFQELQNDADGTDISKKSTDETKKGIGNRDKYTKVSEYEGEVKGEVNIDDKNFTKDTEIPIVIGDFYNIAADKIDFLDINFLTGNTQKKDGKLVHAEDSTWNKIRNPIVEIIRISIYVASAILIVLLILFGIGIVRTGTTNPRKSADYKKGLETFAKALFMLVSTIIIMALCIFFSKVVFEAISESDDYQLPIRVNVKGAYSFSTNITGYFRYMAQGDDLDYVYSKARYAILYAVSVKFNLILEIFMVIRMFALWILAVIGPLLAANYAIRKTGLNKYNAWLYSYVVLSAIQPMFCLVYRIIYNHVDLM